MNFNRFYREARKELMHVKMPASIEIRLKFWGNKWSSPKEYNQNAEWIKRKKERRLDV